MNCPQWIGCIFTNSLPGNGPSALFLSYLLHGNVPIYDPTVHGPHPDPILHQKLLQIGPNRPLYDALDSPKACSALTEHFSASTSMSYSTQALPINVLLDTLMRPNADTEIGETRTRIRWDRDPSRRVDHLVLGDAGKAGGQWAEDAVGGNWDCETLRCANSSPITTGGASWSMCCIATYCFTSIASTPFAITHD